MPCLPALPACPLGTKTEANQARGRGFIKTPSTGQRGCGLAISLGGVVAFRWLLPPPKEGISSHIACDKLTILLAATA